MYMDSFEDKVLCVPYVVTHRKWLGVLIRIEA